MENKFVTYEMQESDIAEAVNIWADQYLRYCSSKSFPQSWLNNTSSIAGFLHKKVQDKAAIIVKSGNKLLGYLTYDEFPFNGEKSVFCPAIAHAAIEEYKEEVYLSLYKRISKEWVGRNVFNHMWTFFYNDTKLRGILYDLGFGSYLIDAFSCTNNLINASEAKAIRRAEIQDVDVLSDLVEESREYYRSAPIFLRRDQYSRDDILDIIQKSAVFIAWEANSAIGFMNVSVSQRDNLIDLSVHQCGLLDEIGAYIKPEFRGKGLGIELLKHVFDYCNNNGVEGIHVDFETANLFANKFWRKYFDPMLLSVRRTINKDINDPQPKNE